ncbi:hypothetical protein [Jeotgalicoccus sp. FSL K6-3177]|uniref:hypothetical protein n=1 Tax=Jeotgalicoccus sp. FSL K6-3177 TaxID=2921494 RepID=UPI0030FD7AD4
MPSRTKLFITSTDDDGKIDLYMHGIAFTPERNGTMFIVDEWLIPQIDKVQFKDGELSVKDGAELIPPVKSEKELKREALLKQIAELDAAEEEPADTEEQTDAPLLDYTDEPAE